MIKWDSYLRISEFAKIIEKFGQNKHGEPIIYIRSKAYQVRTLDMKINIEGYIPLRLETDDKFITYFKSGMTPLDKLKLFLESQKFHPDPETLANISELLSINYGFNNTAAAHKLMNQYAIYF